MSEEQQNQEQEAVVEQEKVGKERGVEEDYIHVAICTPSYGYMKTQYVLSMMQMMAYFMGTPVLGQEGKRHSYSYHVIEGSMICTARENMFEAMLDKQYGLEPTHLLFVDEDMGFRRDVLNILLSRQVEFVGCNYLMKRWPKQFCARNKDGTAWIETTAEKNSLEPSNLIPMGMTLLDRVVWKKLGPSKPNFLCEWSPPWQTYGTEDGFLCRKAMEIGIQPYVDHKASKLVFHMGNHAYSWDDPAEMVHRYPYAMRMQVT